MHFLPPVSNPPSHPVSDDVLLPACGTGGIPFQPGIDAIGLGGIWRGTRWIVH